MSTSICEDCRRTQKEHIEEYGMWCECCGELCDLCVHKYTGERIIFEKPLDDEPIQNRTSVEKQCFNCWTTGHYTADCPKSQRS